MAGLPEEAPACARPAACDPDRRPPRRPPLQRADVARALASLQPSFRFLLDDLACATEADLDARALSTMAHLSLLLLQHARHQPPAAAITAIARWGHLVHAIGRTPNGRRRLFLPWSYFLAVTDVRPEQLHRVVVEILDETAGETVMSTADKLIAKGRREGRAEGKAEGRIAGVAAVSFAG